MFNFHKGLLAVFVVGIFIQHNIPKWYIRDVVFEVKCKRQGARLLYEVRWRKTCHDLIFHSSLLYRKICLTFCWYIFHLHEINYNQRRILFKNFCSSLWQVEIISFNYILNEACLSYIYLLRRFNNTIMKFIFIVYDGHVWVAYGSSRLDG